MTQPHPHAEAARTAKQLAADAVGIDAEFVSVLVERFYDRVRADPLLGPIFAARIDDWPPHLARMKQFWSTILRGEGQFSGNPMRMHVAIPGIEAQHFERWLALFGETLRELERDPAATVLIAERARAIADSLLTGIRIHRDGRRDLQAMKGMTHA